MPVRVYELAGTGAARTRLEVAGARGFTHFVGRESELASLETALDRVVADAGQVAGRLGAMRGYFDIGEQDAGQAARDQVAGKVLSLDESLRDALPLLFEFLGVPDPERPAPRMTRRPASAKSSRR